MAEELITAAFMPYSARNQAMMSVMTSSAHLAALAHPVIGLIIAAFFLAASVIRNSDYFLPIAIAYIAFSIGIFAQILLVPSDPDTNAMLTGAAYAIAALSFYLGLVRAGQAKPFWPLAIALTVVFLGLRFFHTMHDPNSISRIYGIQTYLALVFLLACWHIRALLLRGSGTERFLFLSVFIFALSLLPRTLLTVGSDTSRYGFDSTPYWVATQIAFNGFIVIFSLALLLVHASRHLKLAETKASLDPLTRLNNRASFNVKAEALRARCASYSLIAIDLDKFKSINDLYGHHAGDRVLEHVSALISSSTREADEAARYGGEEFLVFLPDTGIEKAQGIAERLRRSLADMRMHDIAPELRCTASFGVAEFKPDVPLKMAHRRVDQLMYAAKAQGRNRVSHASQPISVESLQRASQDGTPAD